MTPWVKRLLFANVVVYFLTMNSRELFFTLAYIPAQVLTRPWTPVTSMFVHAGLMHILFNMLGLYFFGPRLEARLGSKNFIWLYMVSGLMGAALSFLTPQAAIVGASGAVFGVFLGFAKFWPTAQVYIWGILPVQARWLVVGMTALSLWGGFGGVQQGVAHFAHLGGFLGGFLWLKWIEARSPAKRFKKQVYAHVAPSATKDPEHVKRWMNIRREDLHEINRDEVDRLLRKIERDGVKSLSLDERAFLDRFVPL